MVRATQGTMLMAGPAETVFEGTVELPVLTSQEGQEMNINAHYAALEQSYLFSRIAQKVREYQQQYPDKSIIKMGIGDVTQPLCPAVIKALHAAVDEMGTKETFRRLRAGAGLSVPARIGAGILCFPWRVPGNGRDLHRRRRQERSGQHPGSFRQGQRGLDTRSGLSRVCGYQRHGGP